MNRTIRIGLATAALAALSVVANAQWRIVSTSPKEPPYTTVKEVNGRGETKETHYTREKDGRVSKMSEIRKNKKGETIFILNEWYGPHGEMQGGFKQEFGPPRMDYRWDPKRKGWVEVLTDKPWSPGDQHPGHHRGG
jgi:hypothetical protein